MSESESESPSTQVPAVPQYRPVQILRTPWQEQMTAPYLPGKQKTKQKNRRYQQLHHFQFLSSSLLFIASGNRSPSSNTNTQTHVSSTPPPPPGSHPARALASLPSHNPIRQIPIPLCIINQPTGLIAVRLPFNPGQAPASLQTLQISSALASCPGFIPCVWTPPRL